MKMKLAASSTLYVRVATHHRLVHCAGTLHTVNANNCGCLGDVRGSKIEWFLVFTTGFLTRQAPILKYKILLSSPHTFFYKSGGKKLLKISRKFILGDHILNSHDLSDRFSIDINRRNLLMITIGLKRVKWDGFHGHVSWFYMWNCLFSWWNCLGITDYRKKRQQIACILANE